MKTWFAFGCGFLVAFTIFSGPSDCPEPAVAEELASVEEPNEDFAASDVYIWFNNQMERDSLQPVVYRFCYDIGYQLQTCDPVSFEELIDLVGNNPVYQECVVAAAGNWICTHTLRPGALTTSENE